MIAKELYSLSAAPIVNTLFSAQWSEDDQISVVTEVGVHTFKLVPTPLSTKRVLHLNRSYLYPSDHLPTEKFSDEVNNYIATWEREQVYTLLLEPAISPKPRGINPVDPRIADVAWSPQGLLQPMQCMLTTLTSVGAVDIAVKVNRQWYSIHDLSQQWSKHLEEQPNNAPNDDDHYAIYAAKARRLQATSICWSDIHQVDSRKYAYLAVAYRSSDLVFWRIDKVRDNSQKDVTPAQIAYKLDLTHDAKVRVMHWVRTVEGICYLFVGYHDGKLQCVEVIEDPDDLNLQVRILKDLLESDKVPVCSINLIKKREHGIDLVVTKGTSLIYLRLDEDGCLFKTLTFRSPGFQIAGATPVNTEQVLLFSENGKLTLATILAEEIQGVPVSHELVTNRLRCLGLCGSVNQTIFVAVTSPNSIYDHLVQREPSTVHFFYIDDERKDPFTILMSDEVGLNVGSYWDCLEVLRIKLIDDPRYAEALCTRNDLENMKCGLLTTTLWINMIKQNICKSDASTTQSPYNCNEAKSLIFLHSAVDILLRLGTKSKPLSEEEKTIMGLLKVYLEVYIGINDANTLISRKIRDALSCIKDLPMNEGETCGLCNLPVCDSSSTTSLCPTGHKLPRCSLTLMQITAIKFRICPICKLIFHLVTEKIFQEPKCLYCDVALVYDPRISGLKIKGSMKNLSIPSISLSKRGENNGMEEEEGDGDM